MRRGWVVAVVVLVLVVGMPRSDAGVVESLPLPQSQLLDPNVYPARGFSDIKGLQPDFWPNKADISPGLGTVSMNLFWPEWEPSPAAPPCGLGRPIEFDGHCFALPTAVDDAIREYTNLGVSVTAIVYGTPAWARGSRPCDPVSPGFAVFCVPDDPTTYGRFAAMIAARYNGAGGFGRITDFVIQNEVNANMWFNIGCGPGVPCDLTSWVADYAALYNVAYDGIRSAQPHARVLFSFEHDFGAALDAPDLPHPLRAVEIFLPQLVPHVGSREWSVAFHPYPATWSPLIGARDYPWVTLGNVGIIVGWLRQQYPNSPHAWEVQLTEQGLNNPGIYDQEQVDALCQSFRNVLGTPGITSFIYHRMSDNAEEGGLALGLRRIDGTAKPAFDTWRHATDPNAPSCGFDRAGRTIIQHGLDPTTGKHWFSSRDLPVGYAAQSEQWPLSYDPVPGTTMLYECATAAVDATYLWASADCRGDLPMGPVGYIATTPAAGRTPLYACTDGTQTIATTAPSCGGTAQQQLLGYVVGTPAPSPTTTTPSPNRTAVPSSVSPVVAVPRFTG